MKNSSSSSASSDDFSSEPDATGSPTKACLIAPSFSPAPKNAKRLKQHHGGGGGDGDDDDDHPASKNNIVCSTSKSFTSIDNAVRAAYKQVRNERDLQRKRLVRDVIAASRDTVIHDMLHKKGNNDADVVEETKQSNPSSIGIAGNIHSEETIAPTQSNGKRKRRTIFDQIEVAVSNLHRDKKRSRSSSSSADIPTSPTHVADQETNYDNNIGGTRGMQASPTTTNTTTTTTLVFPRLPSNGCPSMHHIIFPPSLRSRQNNGASKNATDPPIIASAPPPPPNLSSKEGKNDYSVSIKHCNGGGGGGGGTGTAGGSGGIVTTTYPTLLIEGAHAPRPKSSSMIFLKSTIFVDDEPTLNHVPYLGDGVNEDIFSELYDTKKRERLYEFGPPYQEKETLETIDEVLKLMAVQKPHLFDDVALFHETVAASAAVVTSEGNNMPSDNGNESDTAAATENKVPITPGQLHVKLLRRIHVLLAELTNVDLERVHERHSACFVVRDDGRSEDVDKRFRTSSFSGEHSACFVRDARSNDDKRTRTSSFSEDHANTNCHNKAAAGPAASKGAATIPYPMLMDSYRSLFCRRCFTYDCAIHGNLPQASLDLLGELAVQKEKDGHWKVLDKDISDEVPKSGSLDDGIEEHTTPADLSICRRALLTFQGMLRLDDKILTPVQQAVCRHAHLIFQGDIKKMAETIGISPVSVDAFVKAEEIELPPRKFVFAEPAKKKHGSRNRNCAYTSMKNYNQNWLRHIQSKIIHPEFLPCDHDGPCREDTCSCIRNGFFCTKHCGYGNKSPNFFRGCECKAGQCRLYSCPCYAANRECDPDLCRSCGACSDPPDAPAGDGQRCRNDNISMGRRAHTLVAESTIKEAGWGLFNKHELKKGDFVIEYVGERISQEEAERRGVVYDKLNMSYLFNLNSDTVIDATRKGNKARFINHSSTPNIEPKVVHVNGDMRIGFFAKLDIDAQSELFFDYRYDDKIDNELIFKPDHSIHFDWMKKKKN